jgi:hypothetical protein
VLVLLPGSTVEQTSPNIAVGSSESVWLIYCTRYPLSPRVCCSSRSPTSAGSPRNPKHQQPSSALSRNSRSPTGHSPLLGRVNYHHSKHVAISRSTFLSFFHAYAYYDNRLYLPECRHFPLPARLRERALAGHATQLTPRRVVRHRPSWCFESGPDRTPTGSIDLGVGNYPPSMWGSSAFDDALRSFGEDPATFMANPTAVNFHQHACAAPVAGE